MVETSKRGSDRKLRICLENTAGFPALQLAVKKLGADNIRSMPTEMPDAAAPGEDAVVAFIRNSAVGKQVLSTLALRPGNLPPSGYHIAGVPHRGGRVLAVIGGDLFGMLAGLADMFLHSELTTRALLYRGGIRTEKPVFPMRYYWTWDHSTNWMLDDEGNQLGKDGQRSTREISPYHPENQAWIKGGVEWLYRNFPIGGSNMENDDLMVDYSAAGKRGRARIKSGELDFFKDQFFAYKTALDVAHALNPKRWHAYATYSGFGRGTQVGNAQADMGKEPYYSKRMPLSAIAQWTLSGMLSAKPITLREWMDHPRPPSAYKNPKWPKGLRPPTPRSAGFVHQASQWSWPLRRNDVAVSTFAEACLRGHEAGLEGISVHGEVTARILAWKLNYLAMRHWTYHPESTLEEFALADLAPRLGGEKDARLFAEVMCRLEEHKTGPELIKKVGEYARLWSPFVVNPKYNLAAWHMWEELEKWMNADNPNKSISHGITHVA